MLKHSLTHSHYGTPGGVSLPMPTPHPLTSSSHSGDGSTSLHRDRMSQGQLQHQDHQQRLIHQQSHIDPTRFLEGQLSPPHAHSHSQSYLDQSYPGIHSSRLYLDTSRGSRPQGHHHRHRTQSQTHTTPTSSQPKQNGSIFFTSPPPPPPSLHHHPDLTATSGHLQAGSGSTFRQGVLRSLSLLSILSLLLALNSLVFLLKIVWPLNMSGGGSDSEFKLMYEVTLCLAAMCLSISLCVLLVTSAQYFFAISGSPGTTSFLHKVTLIRAGATGGFFLSIPLFLAAIVLYTFTHLSFAVPALVTTAIVGLAIIFGGCAMVYHVFSWQREKTNKRILVQDVSPNPTIELSTLV